MTTIDATGENRLTVCKEYVEEAEVFRVVHILEVIGTSLVEGGPVDNPAFACRARGEQLETEYSE